MAEAAAPPLLEVRGLTVRYGSTVALRDVSLAVGEGQVAAVLGPNGAGKTTLVSAIAGAVPAAAGEILWRGEPVTAVGPGVRVGRGLCLVPEGREIFATLTVEENLMVGATGRPDRAGARADRDRFYAMFPILAERRSQPAGRLSGGEQQMLAIARGLMTRPTLLLLDEPSLGLAPRIVDRVYDILRQVRDSGVALIVVEQTRRALPLADRIHVLSGGRVRLSGPAGELARHPELEASYFGLEGAAGP